jgi:hypothetical protein
MRTLLLLWFALPAWAQFQLYVVNGQNEAVAPALYDLGSIYSDETATAHFRLRNTTTMPAMVTLLDVAGAGFHLAPPALPWSLAPQAALDFTVTFQAASTGSYSAALRSDGVSILLTASVCPRLTLSGPLDFGTVVRGSSTSQIFTITNGIAQVLIVPAIAVQGADYALEGVPPSGQALLPQQSVVFTIRFAPRTAGPSQGSLAFGDRTYPLTGAGADPPLPKPFLTIDLDRIASAQQGTVVIRFDTPVMTAASGSLVLDFRGPADPTIAFAAGGRAATFNVVPGDTDVRIPFQTGTTAGTLAFTVRLGPVTDQLNLPISAAPVGVALGQGTRKTSTVELAITGFDNTRTLGTLSVMFYDVGANSLTPGGIRTDASADFVRYFATSDAGGAFVLHAVFPVSGDVSRIASCDVTLTNSAGSTKVPRITF